MTPERWHLLQRIFHGALERHVDEREAYLDEACAGDARLRDEVVALLDADRGSALDSGVGALAGAVFEGRGKVPERIGPYRILELLGEGGMGVVYKARRDDIDAIVAIKFLLDARLSPERRERFEREQRILAALDHPAICTLHDAGVLDDGTPYFVMEHVDGLPLTRFCEQYGLDLHARLRLVRQVAEAVGHAHRRMLIHRDIKPSNILALRPERPTVKLLDFGVAKQTVPDPASSDTRTLFRMLTPAYAAPEQLAGEVPGSYSDVYSLGVVLYELLTGSVPFDGDDRSTPPPRPSQRARDSHRAPAFVAAVGRRDWADLDVLCLTAMHDDPERRYPSVDALIADIDRFLAGEPLVARPESLGYRLRKFVARNRRAVLASALVAVAIAGLLVFYTVRLARARDLAVAEAQRSERMLRFTLDLFEGGDPVAGPRRGLDVRTLIERGEREVRTLEGQPAIQAELLHTLGAVHHKLGELERAEALMGEALEQRVAMLGARHPDTIASMTALSAIVSDTGELERAEELARLALERARRDDPRRSAIHEALGVVLTRRGRFDDAFVELERAVALRESAPDSAELRESLGSLANAHFFAGNYERSDALNRRLMRMVGESLGETHPSYATCLINLAGSRKWLGYPEEAERLYRQALSINEAHHGREHPIVASNLSLLAAAMVDQGRHDDAEAMLNEALAITDGVFGPEHPEVALVLNKLAPIAMARDDLAAAERAYRRELEIYRAAYGDEHVRTAAGWSNVATMLYRQGRHAEAEDAMRRAVETFAAALKPDHVDLAMARVKLGQLLAARGRHEQALEQLTVGLAALEAQANPSSAWIEAAREEIAASRTALSE